MNNNRIIEMIDEYLTEPHSISKEWVEALTICKQALKDNEKKDTEIDILIRKNETLKDEVSEQKAEIERLKEENKFHRKTITENAQRALEVTIEEIEKAKSEAIKEFEERVIKLFPKDKNFTTISRFSVKQIAKQLTE